MLLFIFPGLEIGLTMKRDSHLFACHKYLEAIGGELLTRLAKVDFRDTREIGSICGQVEDYVTTLENHARWEEEYIFNRFFTREELLPFFEKHANLESRGKKIIEVLKMISNLAPPTRVCKGKLVYLDFRKFYASNLVHFYKEETSFLSLLQERATDDEIRAIDKPIYQGMSSDEIVEMLKQLLPALNITEKKNILHDLKNFNAANFGTALPEIRKMLSKEEIAELLGEYVP
ncbi:hypothetical protein ACFORL_04390 [Legionella dresdenensis]|uniref:Hemerythrin-like domain-containing protein n=1 Tax=Legionella dresdenensis TaxID=450200 RepID=A0ABV8CDR1_9GAMM